MHRHCAGYHRAEAIGRATRGTHWGAAKCPRANQNLARIVADLRRLQKDSRRRRILDANRAVHPYPFGSGVHAWNLPRVRAQAVSGFGPQSRAWLAVSRRANSARLRDEISSSWGLFTWASAF